MAYVQTLLVVACVAWAMRFLWQKFRREWSSRAGCAKGCASCQANKSITQLSDIIQRQV